MYSQMLQTHKATDGRSTIHCLISHPRHVFMFRNVRALRYQNWTQIPARYFWRIHLKRFTLVPIRTLQNYAHPIMHTSRLLINVSLTCVQCNGIPINSWPRRFQNHTFHVMRLHFLQLLLKWAIYSCWTGRNLTSVVYLRMIFCQSLILKASTIACTGHIKSALLFISPAAFSK